MRDEALIHFHYGQKISAGIHLGKSGLHALQLIEKAMPFFDRKNPGRCVAGFCALHAHFVEDITPPPPKVWPQWKFYEWDQWFGRIHGVFLVDMKALQVINYPMYSCSPITRRGNFSQMPQRMELVNTAP